MDKKETLYFLGGVAIATIFFAIAFSLLKPNTKEHVYLDVDKVISRVATVIAEKKMSKEEAAQQVVIHKKKFEEELQSYAQKNNVIVFSSPKPIAGAKDVTEHFIKRTNGS